MPREWRDRRVPGHRRRHAVCEHRLPAVAQEPGAVALERGDACVAISAKERDGGTPVLGIDIEELGSRLRRRRARRETDHRNSIGQPECEGMVVGLRRTSRRLGRARTSELIRELQEVVDEVEECPTSARVGAPISRAVDGEEANAGQLGCRSSGHWSREVGVPLIRKSGAACQVAPFAVGEPTLVVEHGWCDRPSVTLSRSWCPYDDRPQCARCPCASVRGCHPNEAGTNVIYWRRAARSPVTACLSPIGRTGCVGR